MVGCIRCRCSFTDSRIFLTGAFSLAVASGSKIELSPQLDEVPMLYEWYTNERATVETKTISMAASGGADAFGK